MASIPDSRVLAIASHVVSGYVGNRVVTFVLQLLGLDVAALNTVQFSNHSGYRGMKGFKTTGEQITELYEGLKMNGNDDFGMLLTGYVPGAEGVEAVGRIAKDLKEKRKESKGGFFWVLDPVMGDQERLYVGEDVVPVYKSLLALADLIVPNQFEAEYVLDILILAHELMKTRLLSGIKVDSLESLARAIDEIHRVYNVPHVIITSVTFGSSEKKMKCAGSTRTSTGAARKFVIDVPIIEGFFSGTGDMFAALTLARFREEADRAGLLEIGSWLSPDEIKPLDLPLARAIEKVLGSMGLVLLKTKEARDEKLGLLRSLVADEELDDRARHVRLTKASELRLVQSQKELLNSGVVCQATELE